MKKLHPLINPKSSHYDNGRLTTIEKIEAMLTVDEMIGACKFNILKYNERKELKGALEADVEKIVTYEKYLSVLLKLHKSGMGGFFVSDALKQARSDYVYRVSDLVDMNSLF